MTNEYVKLKVMELLEDQHAWTEIKRSSRYSPEYSFRHDSGIVVSLDVFSVSVEFDYPQKEQWLVLFSRYDFSSSNPKETIGYVVDNKFREWSNMNKDLAFAKLMDQYETTQPQKEERIAGHIGLIGRISDWMSRK
jgi:hypothetical protein